MFPAQPVTLTEGSCLPAAHPHLPPLKLTPSKRLFNFFPEPHPCLQIQSHFNPLPVPTTLWWGGWKGSHGRAPPCDWRLYFLFLAGVCAGGEGRAAPPAARHRNSTKPPLHLVPYTTLVPPIQSPKVNKKIGEHVLDQSLCFMFGIIEKKHGNSLAREYPIYCSFLRFTNSYFLKVLTPQWRYGQCHRCFVVVDILAHF